MFFNFLFGIYFLVSVNIFWQFAASAQEQESEIDYGIVRYIKGDAFILTKGEKNKKPMKIMEKFFDGSEITTADNSFAILKLPDGSTLKLDPETNLKVEGLIQKKGNGYKGSSYFVLTIGGAMVDVVKKFSGPPSLEIETVNQVAFGVRGTTFYIFHDKDSGDIWGTVRQGQVMAMDYAKDDSEAIDAGMSMAVVEGEVLTKPHKYRWAEKLKWSFTEKDGELDTKRAAIMEDRFKELQSLYKKLRTRSKKEFVKEKKAKQKALGNGYRTSSGDYESHDAGLFATRGGGAGFYPTEGSNYSDTDTSGYQGSPALSPPSGSNQPGQSQSGGTPEQLHDDVIVSPSSGGGSSSSSGGSSSSSSGGSSSSSSGGGSSSSSDDDIPDGGDEVVGGNATEACKNFPGALAQEVCGPGRYPFGTTNEDGVIKSCCVPISTDGDSN